MLARAVGEEAEEGVGEGEEEAVLQLLRCQVDAVLKSEYL